MPPHPFVRPAFDVRSEQAAQVAIARMNRAIDEGTETMTEADLYPYLAHLAGGQVYPYVVPPAGWQAVGGASVGGFHA